MTPNEIVRKLKEAENNTELDMENKTCSTCARCRRNRSMADLYERK